MSKLKKITITFFTLICLLLCTCFVVGCGNGSEDESKKDPTHTHEWATEWSNDANTHWHECKVCDEINDYASHDWEEEACAVCGKRVSVNLEYTFYGDSYVISGIGTCTDTDIVIPAAYNGKPVTSIWEDAFSGCDCITSIAIPNSVISIEKNAFSGCSNLTRIVIPDSVTSIEKNAFSGYSLTSITVEKGNKKYHSQGNCLIETESKTLVMGCKNSIIPDDKSVTSIGDSAFRYCSSLTSITIPNSVTSIGNYAFGGCDNLTSIEIPNSVTSIGSGAFSNCDSLTSVKLKNGQSRKTLKAADQCNEKRLNGQFSLLFLFFSRSGTA